MNKVNFRIILGLILVALLVVPMVFAIKYSFLIKSFLYPPKEAVNILVLGKGGVGHSAPDLTDTIMFVSISNKKITLISLPRDIWVPEIRAKLNSAYYWGKQKSEGFKIADDSIKAITGEEINYNLVIDFSLFKKVIDSLGGIEVDVQNSFVDEKYPLAGKENDSCLPCRYETVKFEKGMQIMDGETALKFVRSRNAQGDEGTDIAREVRQQLVISGIKNKVSDLFLNPIKVKSLWDEVMDSIETDINQEALGLLARKAFNSRNSISLSVIPEEMLVHPQISIKYDNQYVFIPKTGNWKEVHAWIASQIKN